MKTIEVFQASVEEAYGFPLTENQIEAIQDDVEYFLPLVIEVENEDDDSSIYKKVVEAIRDESEFRFGSDILRRVNFVDVNWVILHESED